jgi:aspartyl-tRNA(Asn)/glutamyl-tRNA(Gln) amidotransferase subunit B
MSAYICGFMKGEQKYEAVIGLEVHARLLTNSKLFSSDANAYGADRTRM